MAYPEAVNMTGLVDMMQYANVATGNVFVIMLLISTYVIPLIYLLLRGESWPKASMAAGFIVTISTIMLRVAEVTTVDSYIFLAAATIIVPLVFVYLRDDST